MNLLGRPGRPRQQVMITNWGQRRSLTPGG
jgi:hypothetical protein